MRPRDSSQPANHRAAGRCEHSEKAADHGDYPTIIARLLHLTDNNSSNGLAGCDRSTLRTGRDVRRVLLSHHAIHPRARKAARNAIGTAWLQPHRVRGDAEELAHDRPFNVRKQLDGLAYLQ